MSESTEYENGVADVLAYLVGGAAEVRRNVKLPGRRSKTPRQLDVVVFGRMFDLADGTLVVDCKRWRKRTNVVGMGAFIDLVEDVGADLGMLVTINGASQAAKRRAREARGIHVETLTLDELKRWRPPGTVTVTLRIRASREADAAKALRHAGFRVVPQIRKGTGREVALDVFRHYGSRNPSGEIQADHQDLVRRTLEGRGIAVIQVGGGITVGGGTPAHCWLKVTVADVPLGLKVLVATEAEVNAELDRIAQELGLPRGQMSVIRPTEWPVKGLFGLATEDN